MRMIDERRRRRRSASIADWPLRPWLLAALLGVAGLLVWAFWRRGRRRALAHGGGRLRLLRRARAPPSPSSAAVEGAGGLRARRWAWSWLASPGARSRRAIAMPTGIRLRRRRVRDLLALPLFQAGFHRTRFATPYATVHYHVWTDAISAGGSARLRRASWLVLAILAALFNLLKIDCPARPDGEAGSAGPIRARPSARRWASCATSSRSSARCKRW